MDSLQIRTGFACWICSKLTLELLWIRLGFSRSILSIDSVAAFIQDALTLLFLRNLCYVMPFCVSSSF